MSPLGKQIDAKLRKRKIIRDKRIADESTDRVFPVRPLTAKPCVAAPLETRTVKVVLRMNVPQGMPFDNVSEIVHELIDHGFMCAESGVGRFAPLTLKSDQGIHDRSEIESGMSFLSCVALAMDYIEVESVKGVNKGKRQFMTPGTFPASIHQLIAILRRKQYPQSTSQPSE